MESEWKSISWKCDFFTVPKILHFWNMKRPKAMSVLPLKIPQKNSWKNTWECLSEVGREVSALEEFAYLDPSNIRARNTTQMD